MWCKFSGQHDGRGHVVYTRADRDMMATSSFALAGIAGSAVECIFMMDNMQTDSCAWASGGREERQDTSLNRMIA